MPSTSRVPIPLPINLSSPLSKPITPELSTPSTTFPPVAVPLTKSKRLPVVIDPSLIIPLPRDTTKSCPPLNRICPVLRKNSPSRLSPSEILVSVSNPSLVKIVVTSEPFKTSSSPSGTFTTGSIIISLPGTTASVRRRIFCSLSSSGDAGP